MTDLDIFIDSGAFSAKTQGKEIKVEDYADFLDEHGETATVIASLDVIPNSSSHRPEAVELSFRNALYLRERGHDIMPVYHFDEDPSVIRRYLDADFEYIGIGGSVRGGLRGRRSDWLELLFNEHLTDGAGLPLALFHGFGVAGSDCKMFPWRSCDSTSAIIMAGCRQINVPLVNQRNGSVDYTRPSGKICFTTDKAITTSATLVDDEWQVVSGKDNADSWRLTKSGNMRQIIDDVLKSYYGVRLTVEPEEANVMTMRVITHIYMRKAMEQIEGGIRDWRRLSKHLTLVQSESSRQGIEVDDFTYYACTGTPDSHITHAMTVANMKYRLLSYFDLMTKQKNGSMDKYYGMLETGVWNSELTNLDEFPVQLEFLE